MNRLLAAAVSGVALVAVAACGGGDRTPRARTHGPTTLATAGREASPRATAVDRGAVTEAARSALLAGLSTEDLPGHAGTATAAVGRGSALFLWATADDRFCFGDAASDGGFTSSTCTASARDTAFSARPTLIRLATTVAIGTSQTLVLGADRETVRSVTCDGAPLALRRLDGVLDRRRALYAFDLPGETGGSVTVTVVRAHGTAVEHVDLLWKGRRGRTVCH
ncbi:hypothetical protein [Streptomyces sp. NPDC093970]|uniref:hypothetical protein n=1 Tax=Streptomyces sp. NPDC093970 TaxID=3155076 RepID=UPI00343EB823